jgi:hypothetical protein
MTVSFDADILPLFTSMDVDHMGHVGLALDDYSAMSQASIAANVYEQVSTGGMPPSDSGEQPWSEDKVQLFKAWMDGGYQR